MFLYLLPVKKTQAAWHECTLLRNIMVIMLLCCPLTQHQAYDALHIFLMYNIAQHYSHSYNPGLLLPVINVYWTITQQ